MDWKWIAGFYEGEGCASWSNGGQRLRYLYITIPQTEKSILVKMRQFIGYGRICPRHWQKRNGWRRQWKLYFYRHEAFLFAEEILPLMQSPRKIRQLKRAMKKWPVNGGKK